MATAMLLKRQFYPSTRVSISTLTSLLHVIPGSLSGPTTTILTDISTTPPPVYRYSSQTKPLFERASGGHARSGFVTVDFRASFGTRAGFAVDDYSDEEKIKSNGGGGENEGLEIAKLNIHQDIVQALHKKGITKLFPIQRAVLEPAMQGRDMIGRAKTGTGKTLAFGIPIMDKIHRHIAKHGCGRNPMALILAPTRELAKQVEKEFYESSKLDTLCVYGGTPINRQMNALSQGVDVVAGTPGRVIDLMKRNALILSDVQFVVLDEADQMLNVGFADDVEVILEKLPQNRQTMMFSATMPSWILKLTRKFLNDPVTIDLVGDSDQKLAEGISLYSVVVDHRSKAGVIGPLVTEHANGGKCIVFTQTKRDADNLAYALARNNYRCEPLHGDIAQGQRERTLKRFRDGDINILVATDVAARGLDIPNVDLVIHYEMPSTSEIFVHRSGRTGRAGKKGTAILVSTMDQSRAVRVIERDIGCKLKELPPVAVDGVVMETSRGMSSRFGSGIGLDHSGFSRSGGFGNSGFGRQGGYNDSGRSRGYDGQSSGRAFGFGDSGSGGFGSYGDSSNRSSGRSGGFGSYGQSGFGRTGGGFGSGGRSDRSSGFDNLGSSRQDRFADTRSTRSSGGFGGASSRRLGSFGDTRS